MGDNVLLASILAGTACMGVGWVWSILVARKVSAYWFAAIAFVFIFALPFFAISYWGKAKWPFVASVMGFVLTFGSAAFIPGK
jgi:hypothetical protein